MSGELDDSINDYWGNSTKKSGMSVEHKAKISEALKGKKKTKEHLKAQAKSHKSKGRKYICSDKTKRKLSIAAMQFWDNKKKAKTRNL